LITIICIFLKHYLNFDISSNQLNTISLRYGKIQVDAETFLSKLVYFSNKVDKHTAFYEKMREIETKMHYFAEEVVSLKDTNNVFTSIHDMEIQQTALLNRYKMVIKEIDQIKLKSTDSKENSRLRFLKENKKKIKEQLNNPDYSIIREPLEQEYRKYL